jgi:hypothetical protein
MRRLSFGAALALTVILVAVASAGAAPLSFSAPTSIDNPYLPLSSFHRCTLRGEEDSERMRIERTVLDRTRTFVVHGLPVETMIVKDRVHASGRLIESTHDFFAQDDAGAVHYFGERVDNVRADRSVNHHGSWLFGRDTDKLGTLMAADPHVGSHWRSEIALPITLEHDRVVAAPRSVEAGGRTYRHAIRVREFALPDREVEYKLYAKGVGVVDELPPHGDVALTGCTRA